MPSMIVPDKHRAALEAIIAHGNPLGRNFYPVAESVTVYYPCGVCRVRHRITVVLPDHDGLILLDLAATGQCSPCRAQLYKWSEEQSSVFRQRVRRGDYTEVAEASEDILTVRLFGNIQMDDGEFVGRMESFRHGRAPVYFNIESVQWRE